AAYHDLAREALGVWRDLRKKAPEATTAEVDKIGREPERLHALLEKQFYALHGWKRSNEVVNYRRFSTSMASSDCEWNAMRCSTTCMDA
ncbi:MAG TPA: hypothetical protein VIM71_06695, partial [Lacunisphaera sp.]